MNNITDLQILLVEDNFADQVLFKDNLSESDYASVSVKVVEKIFQLDEVRQFNYKPSLIVLDLNLPDSTGITTFKLVQQKFPSTPIIILTGTNDKELGLEAISLGAEDYLIKGSLSVETIERMIDYAIERFNLKKTLLTTNKKLLANQEKMEQFIYIISHDLRSPVTSVQGIIALLQEKISDSDDRYLLTLADNSLDLLLNRIKALNDILNFQQKEKDKTEEAIFLQKIIQDVIEQTSLGLKFKDFDVDINISDDIKIYFSEELLYSVIQNITSNALKYRDTSRRLKLKYSMTFTAENKVLCIEDNGLGMDLRNGQNTIFKLFRRHHTHVAGNGIGLYLVKSIMESNGGHVEVKSKPNKGTSFYLFFLDKLET